MRLATLVVCTCLGLATSLHAQSPSDSMAPGFHDGQWGVQAVVASGVSEAGALRFASPTRAWVLDGSVNVDRQTASGSQASQGDHTFAGFTLSVGSRWYSVPGRLIRFAGVGATGGYTYAHYNGNTVQTDIWSAGAYGEAGAIYMFTPHVGIGSRAMLTLTRIENSSSLSGGFPNPTSRVVDYRLTVSPVQVLATIYF